MVVADLSLSVIQRCGSPSPFSTPQYSSKGYLTMQVSFDILNSTGPPLNNPATRVCFAFLDSEDRLPSEK
ncbi:hypothetical protein Y032_0080g1393 [Ancylostoma ceylanicum]|uniref:Uncharacterized protein n=1 Tax=Ancylostoma ceylanicum TaxID=53326 RepID=A0A016TSR6_9BILA|nr:hypothetical protein Y032_0080g1393 [Ancylostoma ceylanicum]